MSRYVCAVVVTPMIYENLDWRRLNITLPVHFYVKISSG